MATSNSSHVPSATSVVAATIYLLDAGNPCALKRFLIADLQTALGTLRARESQLTPEDRYRVGRAVAAAIEYLESVDELTALSDLLLWHLRRVHGELRD